MDLSRLASVPDQLSLAYYAAPIAAALCHESMLALALSFHTSKENPIATIKGIIQTAQTINGILKNEFLQPYEYSDLTEAKIKSILEAANEA